MKKSHKKFVVRKGIKGFQKMKPDEGSQAHGQPPKPQGLNVYNLRQRRKERQTETDKCDICGRPARILGGKCQSCVSFAKMNKQARAARKRAAEILQDSDAGLTLTMEGKCTENGQKYRIYDVTVERTLDDRDIRAIKDCVHQVRLKYINFAATKETICFFRINGGGIFLVCDYDGLKDFKGAEQKTVWKQFPKMGETKRAGGAAGRFDAGNLRNTKSLNTPNTAGGFVSWDTEEGVGKFMLVKKTSNY